MPLSKFIKVILTQSYEPLLISGNPNLAEAWDKIYSEYCALTGDNTSTHLLQLSKDISYLTNRLEHINQIATWLNNRRSEMLIEILQKDLGFIFTYEDLPTDLEKTLSIAKADIVKLKRRQSELQQAQGATKTDEQTEQSFIETLQVLSKFQGYQVRAKDITVSEYCALIKDFNSHQKIAPNGR